MKNHKVSYFIAGICLFCLAAGSVFWVLEPDAPVLWKIAAAIFITIVSFTAANRVDTKEKKLSYIKISGYLVMFCYAAAMTILFFRFPDNPDTVQLLGELREMLRAAWPGSIVVFLLAISGIAQRQGRKIGVLVIFLILACIAVLYLVFRNQLAPEGYDPAPFLAAAMASLGIAFIRLSKLESYGHI